MTVDKKDILRDFLEKNEVLIVDKNPGSRNRLLKTIYDMGAKRHVIHTASGLGEAEQIIKTKKIGIVLSDYFIGGGSGFDLFKLIRELHPGQHDLCLVLVTANISQTAVAKAAEEDVDSFVIKPYTIQSIQENLVSTVAAKVKPSDYMVKIEEGKRSLQSGQLEGAERALKDALNLHAKPSLALSYLGQLEYLRKHVLEAQGLYVEGLSFNNIHYKCLIGLYDIFMREDKFEEAYQIVKKIAKYFPANPDRLMQVVRLTIRTENYQDMQSYYEIFISLDERAQVLTNYIGAGMYIAGKHYLLSNGPEVALQYFDNIAVSCAEFPKFMRAIISVLVEHNMGADAERYLSRFSAETKEHEDFLISKFLVTAQNSGDDGAILRMGLELYNRNIKDYACLQALIRAMVKSGYREEKLAPFKAEMYALFPERAMVSI